VHELKLDWETTRASIEFSEKKIVNGQSCRVICKGTAMPVPPHPVGKERCINH